MVRMKQRPNVLYVMTDQMNARCLGIRDSQIRTPNLDALAAEGVLFNRAYCNYPVCGPSRASFITGQYPRTHGILGNDIWHEDIAPPPTMPIVFRNMGYQTALVGKSHMIGRWDREGFEWTRYCDMTDGDWRDPLSNDYFKYLHDHGLANAYDLFDDPNQKAFLSDIPSEHFLETWTGDQALSFLQSRDRLRPFFLHLSFQRPHDPLTVPRDQGLLYEPEQIELPPSAIDLFEYRFKSKPKSMQACLERVGGWPYVPADIDDLKHQLAYYYTLITMIDDQIGRVIQYLKESGQYENTIIVFTSDHGDFAGEHGLMFKEMGIYESVHNIPLILSYPGGRKKQELDALVESVDIFPTLCELADIAIPDSVEGNSLLPVIELGEPGKSAVFCQRAPHRQFAVRTEQFRMVYNGRNTEGELYDLALDPHELHNVYEHAEYAPVRAELLEVLLDHTKHFAAKITYVDDREASRQYRNSMKRMMHKRRIPWARLHDLYEE